MNRDELLKLRKSNTVKEVAKLLKVSYSTIVRYLKIYGLSNHFVKYENDPKSLTKLQNDVIDGTLLGDGHITKSYPRYCFRQCKSHEGYVKKINQLLSPFSRNIYEGVSAKPEHDGNKLKSSKTEFLPYCAFQTRTDPIFVELRQKWYPKGLKIVPKDLKLNARICAYWFLDDGSAYAKRKMIQLSTESFTKNEVDFLIDSLKLLEIRSGKIKRDKGYKIGISNRCFLDFIEMVKPYVSDVDCMFYKLDLKDMPIGKEHWGAGKLDMKKAKQIRNLYRTGNYIQVELAKMFGVRREIINRVVNNRIYKEADVGLRGTADAKVIFNYEGGGPINDVS